MDAALLALWLLNLFDAASTWYAVEVVHHAVEINPLMARLMAHGLWAFVVGKVVLMTVALAMYRYAYRNNKHWAKWVVVTCLLALYVSVALWEIYGMIWRLP